MKRILTLLALVLTAFTFKATAQTTCNAGFDFQFVNANTVKFLPAVTTDSPLVQHYWYFDDGSPSVTTISPVHTFAAPGIYNVKHYLFRHTANGTFVCADSLVKTVTIQQTVCNLQANFTFAAATANPLEIHFTNTTVNLAATDSVFWNFGDGSYSNVVSPTHVYAHGGTYNVCLLVKRNNNSGTPCVSEFCKTITVVTPCNIQASFTSTASTANPLEIHFNNTTVNLASTDSIKWTFGDGASSNIVSPTHVYANAGTYNVCLVVRRFNTGSTTPCVSEICKTVTVTAPCNLQANFTSSPSSTNPLEIHFTNTTVNLASTDSIKWTFGDGTSSNVVSPTHVYANAGTYNVCLVIRRFNTGSTTPCVSEICKTLTIQLPCNLQPNFTSTVSTANPLEVHFTNTTVNLAATDSIQWTFGDGSSSNAVNPVHVYAQGGTYNVCLIIRRINAGGTAPCVREICKTVTVTAPCNLVADFVWYRDSTSTIPNTYHFVNTSAPLNSNDSIRWTFGDGTASNAVNPTHSYAQPGTYTVCLRVQKRNANGTLTNCVKEICKTIVVQQLCNVQANFSWQRDSINRKKIYFTNLSAVPNANAIATWSFGDGTSATSWNAVHEYAQPGRYLVCLKIQYNNTCIATKCDSITVEPPAPPCNQLSNYHFVRSTSNSQTYIFTPDYIANDIQYTWTFGDGTGSQSPVSTHHFATPGTYTVCLTAFRNNNCASTTCKTVVVTPQLNCDSFHVSYSYQFDPFIPNKVYFYAIANAAIIDQTWTISRPNANPVILHQNNPSYTFSDTGYYKVCLRVVLANNCVKEYCNYIRINQISNACTLDAYPNPAHNEVKINVLLQQPQLIHVYVYNSINVLVLQKDQQGTVGSNPVALNVSNLVSGIYNVKVVYGNNTCFARFYKL